MTQTTKMKFKGTKQELVEVLNGLYSTGELSGKAFAVAASKNIYTIKTILDDIEEIAKPSEDFMKLSEKVQAVQNQQDSKIQIEALEAKEPEVVAARKTQLEAVNEMLSEEVEVELEGITTAMLPEEIKSHQVSLLTKVIID